MVDPFSYRERLTQPKLILLSTNDRYWPLDALKLYWSELPDPKHVLYVPNQGHGLRDIERVIGSVSAVHRYAAAGKPMPRRRGHSPADPTRSVFRSEPIDPPTARSSGVHTVRHSIFAKRAGRPASVQRQTAATRAR